MRKSCKHCLNYRSTSSEALKTLSKTAVTATGESISLDRLKETAEKQKETAEKQKETMKAVLGVECLVISMGSLLNKLLPEDAKHVEIKIDAIREALRGILGGLAIRERFTKE